MAMDCVIQENQLQAEDFVRLFEAAGWGGMSAGYGGNLPGP